MEDKKIEKIAKCVARKVNDENFKLYTPKSVSNLPLCLIETVYSLRANYTTTENVIDRFISKKIQRKCCDYNVSDFLKDINEGNEDINNLNKVVGLTNDLENKQKLPGVSRKNIEEDRPEDFKAYAVIQLARYLKKLKVNTKEDFKNYRDEEFLRIVVTGVRGVGETGYAYLRMLTGDENLCKPDIHVKRFLTRIIQDEDKKEDEEITITNEDCQRILERAFYNYIDKGKFKSVRYLDASIWNWQKSKRSNLKIKKIKTSDRKVEC